MSPPTPDVMVDAFPGLHPAGGIGRYVRDLSHVLLHHPEAPPARFAYPRDLARVAEARYPAHTRLPLPLPWKPWALTLAAGTAIGATFDRAYGHPAVYHSTLGYGPQFARAVSLVHLHDLTFLEQPQWHPVHTRRFLAFCAPRAARAATRVLTHSHHVAERVHRVLGVPRELIVTIPPPLGHAFRPIGAVAARPRVREQFGLDGPFILHVGTIEPRKDHATLVAAFEHMRRAGFPGPLVLVGRDGWGTAPILARIESSPERARIVRLAAVSEDELVALYGACTACAFPSLEEGFGMPVLESFACGAPCVTSDHSALIELGAGLARSVPIADPVALADALLDVWRTPAAAERSRVEGPGIAAQYAIERWAPRIFDLYRELGRIAESRGWTHEGSSR